jgi:hypothetical protein
MRVQRHPAVSSWIASCTEHICVEFDVSPRLLELRLSQRAHVDHWCVIVTREAAFIIDADLWGRASVSRAGAPMRATIPQGRR